jgi:hypothetical protein
MGKAIAYLRVSTQQQHRSGLGIEAQRGFAEAEWLTIVGKGTRQPDMEEKLAALGFQAVVSNRTSLLREFRPIFRNGKR